MSMFEQDLAALFAEPLLSVPASIGSASTRGFFGYEDVLEEHAGGFVTKSRQVLTIPAGSLAGLPDPGTIVGDIDITIDGTSYRVRDVQHASYKVWKVIVA